MQNKLVKPLSFLILACFILSSCTDWRTGKFTITNLTNSAIDSLYIEPNFNIRNKFVTIKAGETMSYRTDMGGQRVDGMHMIYYIINGNHKSNGLLYYSNGAFAEDVVKIQIFDDSVSIKPFYSDK